MATGYAQQSIIHSNHSKQFQPQQRSAVKPKLGKLMRGSVSAQVSRKSKDKSYSQINSKMTTFEIELNSKKRRTVYQHVSQTPTMPSRSNKREQIVIMESTAYPSVYFKKTTLRNVLKQFTFPDNAKALPPNDPRTPLMFQIASNLFSEINLHNYNILTAEHSILSNLYIFFSDNEVTPYSKCCHAPIYIQLLQNGSGRILCNSNKCKSSHLVEFTINLQDLSKLWNRFPHLNLASSNEKRLKSRVSRLVNNGRYKKVGLHSSFNVQDAPRQVVTIFSTARKEENKVSKTIENQSSNTFLTANYVQNRNHLKTAPAESVEVIFEDEHGDFTDFNINIASNDIMSKTYTGLQTKLSQALVKQGKVFQKNFDLANSIDAEIFNQRRRKLNGRLNFNRILAQFHKMKTTFSTNTIPDQPNLAHNLTL